MRSLRRIPSQPPPAPSWQADIRLLATSRGISMAGAQAGYIALLALAWDLTGEAGQASLVLLASVVAQTLGAPLAGWIGDHCSRRIVIVVAECWIAACLCAMALATTMPQLFAICLLYGFAASTCGAAIDASLGGLVPKRDLTRANSTMGIARTAGHMVGPILGGVAVASLGARGAFLLDAASSLVAAAIVLAIRGRFGGRVTGRHVGSEHDGSMLAGLRLLATDPILQLLLASWGAMCVCFAFVTAAELPLAVHFGVDEPGLGAIVSSWCAGALVGAWYARRVAIESRGAMVLACNAASCAVVFGVVAIAPAFWCVLVLMAAGGCSMALAGVVSATIVQQRTDDAVRARVMAAWHGVLGAVWGTNLAVAGLVVDAWSPQAAYGYGACWCLVAAIGFAGLCARRRRRADAEFLRTLRPRHALEAELTRSA